MSIQPYEAYAKHAGHGGARAGSPFTSDRTFRRRVSFAVQTIRAIRDLLALVAVVAIITGVLSLLTVAPHFA